MNNRLDFARNDGLMRFFVRHESWFGNPRRLPLVSFSACIPVFAANAVDVFVLQTRESLWECDTLYFFINYFLVVPFMLWITLAVFRDIGKMLQVLCDERLFVVEIEEMNVYYKRFEEMLDGVPSLCFYTLLVFTEGFVFTMKVAGRGDATVTPGCTFVLMSSYNSVIYTVLTAASVGAVAWLAAMVNLRAAKRWYFSLGLVCAAFAGMYYAAIENVLLMSSGVCCIRTVSITDIVHLPVAFVSLYMVAQLFFRLLMFFLSFDEFFSKIKVNIEPYHPDMCGGFSVVGRFFVKYFVVSAAVAGCMLLAYYVKSIHSAEFGDNVQSLVLVGAVVIVEALFVWVLVYRVHVAMKRKRNALLHDVNDRYNEIVESCRGNLLDGEVCSESKRMDELRKHILSYPVYPMSRTAFMNFIVPGSVFQLVSFCISLYQYVKK